MKTDIKGVSTCQPGQEHWEQYFSNVFHQMRVQYDYRMPDGALFSCVSKSLDQARAKRDNWLAEREQPADDKPTKKGK